MNREGLSRTKEKTMTTPSSEEAIAMERLRKAAEKNRRLRNSRKTCLVMIFLLTLVAQFSGGMVLIAILAAQILLLIALIFTATPMTDDRRRDSSRMECGHDC